MSNHYSKLLLTKNSMDKPIVIVDNKITEYDDWENKRDKKETRQRGKDRKYSDEEE